jgi:hypothetical protein
MNFLDINHFIYKINITLFFFLIQKNINISNFLNIQVYIFYYNVLKKDNKKNKF